MKAISFRFDVDTPACFSKGVPNLLDVAQEVGCGFTFYINVGKSISRSSLLRPLHAVSKQPAVKLGAIEKFGFWAVADILLNNRHVADDQAVIGRLLNSECELGLHGGRNHGIWQRSAHLWNEDDLLAEVQWGVKEFHSIFGRMPTGFSSPGWNSPEGLPSILKKMGFKYFADKHGFESEAICNSSEIPNVVTQLTGEPGGVGYIESLVARGLTSKDFIERFISDMKKCFVFFDHIVIYDHPGYSGVKTLSLLKSMVYAALKEGVQIATVEEMVNKKAK